MARVSRKHVLMVVFALLLMSFLGACGMTYLLATDRGNRWLCGYVSAQIDKALSGKIEIARIVDLKLDSIVAKGVRFIAPDGEVAIDAPDVTMDFDPIAMMRGHYGWSRAVILKPLVRVTQNDHEKTNMELLFQEPKGQHRNDKGQKHAPVDMQKMITKDAKLYIGGGTLPELALTSLNGVMGIVIDEQGECTIRFDGYQGKLAGLPIGDLDFHDVKGQVWSAGKHLLKFEGAGTTKGEPVDFDLRIDSKPTDVHIGARFDEVSLASMHTRLVAAWSKFKPNLDIDVSRR